MRSDGIVDEFVDALWHFLVPGRNLLFILGAGLFERAYLLARCLERTSQNSQKSIGEAGALALCHNGGPELDIALHFTRLHIDVDGHIVLFR